MRLNRPFFAVGLLTLVAACAVAPGVSVVSPASRAVIGGATFRPLQPDEARQLTAGLTSSYFLPHRPDLHGVISTAVHVTSGNENFEAAFHAPAALGDVALASCLATTLPAAGNYVQERVLPLVRAWASDGVLDTAYTRLPDLGAMRAGTEQPFDPSRVKDEAAILANAGWPLAYVSASRREVLYFYDSGLVVKLAWAPKDLTEATAPITREMAIARHVATMHDPAAKSEEERTGRDYFIDVPFKDLFPPPPVNNHDELQPAYDFPADTPWTALFDYQYAGKPTWRIYASQGSGLGYGLVDARTGTEIRFQRPIKGFVSGPVIPLPNGSVIPAPSPVGSPFNPDVRFERQQGCLGDRMTLHLRGFRTGRVRFWLAHDRPNGPFIITTDPHPFQALLGSVDLPSTGFGDFSFEIPARLGPTGSGGEVVLAPGSSYSIMVEQDGWDGSTELGFEVPAVPCAPASPAPTPHFSWSPASPCLNERLTLHGEGMSGKTALVMLDQGPRPPRFPGGFPFLYLGTVPVVDGKVDLAFVPADGPPASPDPRLGPSPPKITGDQTYRFRVYDQDGTREVPAPEAFTIRACQ